MNTLSTKDFRNSMASVFNRTDAGEHVFIRRNKRLYTLIPVVDERPVISAELMAQIEQARMEHREGRTLIFSSATEAQRWMDEL